MVLIPRILWKGTSWFSGAKTVPLLDSVETDEEGNRHEDDDCFLAVANVELWLPVESASIALVKEGSHRAGVHDLPHGQRQIVEVSVQTSCPGC